MANTKRLLGVTLVALLCHAPSATARSFQWSGYRWTVRHTYGPSDPGHNVWSDTRASARVRSDGKLRLSIERGRAVEVSGPALGYGTYTWVVQTRLDQLNNWQVFGTFAHTHRGEQDMEFARWGVPGSPVGWRVSWLDGQRQGFDNFVMPRTAPYTITIHWESARVAFSITDASGMVFANTVSAIPSGAGARPRISYWLWPGVSGSRLTRKVKYGYNRPIIVKSFRFTK